MRPLCQLDKGAPQATVDVYRRRKGPLLQADTGFSSNLRFSEQSTVWIQPSLVLQQSLCAKRKVYDDKRRLWCGDRNKG